MTTISILSHMYRMPYRLMATLETTIRTLFRSPDRMHFANLHAWLHMSRRLSNRIKASTRLHLSFLGIK